MPEAFATPTRACRVTHETGGPIDAGGSGAQARFDRWVDARIEDALEASWPDDRPLAVAYTSDGHLLRRYDEDGCGQLDWLVGRVRREAAAIDTPWVFGAALPRPQPYWDMVFDEDGNDIDEVLRAPSRSEWMATWFAEARGGGVADTVAGYLYLDGEEVISAGSLQARSTPVTRAFHRMLYRHPARRLYPLRRSNRATR